MSKKRSLLDYLVVKKIHVAVPTDPAPSVPVQPGRVVAVAEVSSSAAPQKRRRLEQEARDDAPGLPDMADLRRLLASASAPPGPAVVDVRDRSWSLRYAPAAELERLTVAQRKLVDSIRIYCDSRRRDKWKGTQVMTVVGPPGSGKLTAVRCALRAFGYEPEVISDRDTSLQHVYAMCQMSSAPPLSSLLPGAAAPGARRRAVVLLEPASWDRGRSEAKDVLHLRDLEALLVTHRPENADRVSEYRRELRALGRDGARGRGTKHARGKHKTLGERLGLKPPFLEPIACPLFVLSSDTGGDNQAMRNFLKRRSSWVERLGPPTDEEAYALSRHVLGLALGDGVVDPLHVIYPPAGAAAAAAGARPLPRLTLEMQATVRDCWSESSRDLRQFLVWMQLRCQTVPYAAGARAEADEKEAWSPTLHCRLRDTAQPELFAAVQRHIVACPTLPAMVEWLESGGAGGGWSRAVWLYSNHLASLGVANGGPAEQQQTLPGARSAAQRPPPSGGSRAEETRLMGHVAAASNLA